MELYEIDFRGEKVYITDLRIRKQDMSKNLYYYDIKYNDEEMPCSIEQHVLMNHWGTMVSTKNINNILFGRHTRSTCITEEEALSFCNALYENMAIDYNAIKNKIA